MDQFHCQHPPGRKELQDAWNAKDGVALELRAKLFLRSSFLEVVAFLEEALLELGVQSREIHARGDDPSKCRTGLEERKCPRDRFFNAGILDFGGAVGPVPQDGPV